MTVRPALIVFALSFSLTACLETTGVNSLAPEPASAKKTASAKAAPAAAAKPAVAAKTGPADQVRAELKSQCTVEHGGLFGDEKVSSQCDCYAAAAVKNMGKDGLEYYLQYKIVPTVTGPRPEEMKTACGIANVLPANKSGRPAPPPGG